MEIQGYSNYLIYDDGRVWSKYFKNTRTGKFIKPIMDTNGYLRVCLSNQKRYSIHRLVAIHYIPNPENKLEVHHEDGNKTNNHISNLRWVNRIENCNGFMTIRTNNKSGHKNICYDKNKNKWAFNKNIYKQTYQKSFKTKTDAICYKYIFLLRMKANHFKV
jgi:hypothetical protein